MNNKLTINIGEKKFNIFIGDIFAISDESSFVHQHNYTEIHIISGGKTVFDIQQKNYELKQSSIIAVPGNVFHSWKHESENIIHCAFQTDIPVNTVKIQSLNTDIAEGLLREISDSYITNDYTLTCAYFNLLCSLVCDVDKIYAQKNNDYSFVIHEFFNNHYNENIKLKDLSDELHLSERQTERIVISVTGKSFRNHLAHIRISMAKYIIENTDMSLGEIARYVGYKSYAGFWKAYNKYECTNRT